MMLLLDLGADIEAKGYDGNTALHLAVESRHEAMMRLLLDHKVDVEAKTGEGVHDEFATERTALHLAAKNGSEVAMRLLLENGADVEAKDYDGNMALHLAVESG